MTIGEKITTERKILNYTQEQLADLLNVSRQTISKWELNQCFPETNKILELCQIFNCSTDFLLKNEITDKNFVSNPTKKKKFFNFLTNKKTKKALNIIGIIFAILLAIDFISMILYFAIKGLPN